MRFDTLLGGGIDAGQQTGFVQERADAVADFTHQGYLRQYAVEDTGDQGYGYFLRGIDYDLDGAGLVGTDLVAEAGRDDDGRLRLARGHTLIGYRQASHLGGIQNVDSCQRSDHLLAIRPRVFVDHQQIEGYLLCLLTTAPANNLRCVDQTADQDRQ